MGEREKVWVAHSGPVKHCIVAHLASGQVSSGSYFFNSNTLLALLQIVYIHQRSHPSAWLTCTRNGARLVLLFHRYRSFQVRLLSTRAARFILFYQRILSKNAIDSFYPGHALMKMLFNSCWDSPRRWGKLVSSYTGMVCLSYITNELGI